MKAIIDNDPKKKCTILTNNGNIALVQIDRTSERKIVFAHRLIYQTFYKNLDNINCKE